MPWTAIMKDGEKITGDYVIRHKIKDRIPDLKAIQFEDYGVPCTMTFPGGMFGCGGIMFMISETPLTGPLHLICDRAEELDLVGGVPQPRQTIGARIGIQGVNELGQKEKRVVSIYVNGAVSIDRQVIGDMKAKG